MPPFAPKGPLGRFPCFTALTAAFRLPDAPALLACTLLGSFVSRRWRRDLPGSWGTLVRMPWSLTPVSRRASALWPVPTACATMLPSAVLKASASTTICSFGAQSHGLLTRCLRFAATVARVLIYGHAKLAPGGWHTFAGRAFHPLGSFMKFQLRCLTLRPPHPGFAWRTSTDHIETRMRSEDFALCASAPGARSET